MDSTSTLSPPISCARDAKSVVAVMMRILLSALPVTGKSGANTSAKDEAIAAKWVFVNKRGIENLQERLKTGERRARPSRKEIGKVIHWRLRNRMEHLPDGRSGTARGSG